MQQMAWTTSVIMPFVAGRL